MIQNEFQNRLRRYLLGELADGARDEIEQDLLANEDVFEEILMVEEELADEYTAGRLSREERANFETHFLSTPERQQNLRFAQALNRYVTTEGSRKTLAESVSPGVWARKPWVVKVAGAAAIIVVAIGALWFFLPRAQTPRTFATLTLTNSPNTRDESAQATKVPLPLSADALRIFLKLPNPSPLAIRYRVELLDDNGGTKSREAAGQDAQSVVVIIPSAELRRGRYAINLFAIQADGTAQRINGSYYFTIE